MSKLNKQQWADIEKKLQCFYNPVHLNCDGYKVTLTLCQIKQFENAITVYVDDYLKGIWMLIERDTEEGKRFFPMRSKARYPEKEKKQLIRIFGKREARERYSLDKRLEWREPYWKAFSSLKRHLIANNESIEWVENDE